MPGIITDKAGFFTYSAVITTEGEHTFDFFFSDMPDSAKGTASHTVATMVAPEPADPAMEDWFDIAGYVPGTPVAIADQADVVGLQTFLDLGNGWTDGTPDTVYEDMFIMDTLVASGTDAKIAEKLSGGLYMVFYGVEGVGAGNDTTAASALTAVPLVVHVESAKAGTAAANLNLLGIIDDTQLADITAGNIGVVSVAVLDSADGDMRISLLAREQLQVLAELAGNTANLADAGDRKFADTITRDCVKI